MVENGLMKLVNGKPWLAAMFLGSPCWTHMARVEVIVMPASNTGEATVLPFNRLLPDSHAITGLNLA